VAKALKTARPEERGKVPKPSGEGPGKGAGKKKGGKLPGELAAFEEGCVIGNRRTKKYHVPGGRGYDRAKTSTNAVFFKTAEDAKAAG
jgi:DNA-entry nuclease